MSTERSAGFAPATSVPSSLRRPTRIQPSRGWSALDLRGVWAFRDLLWTLAERDVKLRYKQTVLGVIWVVLQPLVASSLFALVFGRLANLPSDGVPYFLFVYVGLLPWTLFAASLQRASSSVVADAALVSKVYFPRMVIPAASLAAVVVDTTVTLAILVVLLAVYRAPVTGAALLAPVFLLLALLISLGVSLWLSALTVYYRDFSHALPFVLQIWMYASPLVYSASLIPSDWRFLYALNPMVGPINGFRWALLGTEAPPWWELAASLVLGLLLFVGGAFVFRRVERTFADVI